MRPLVVAMMVLAMGEWPDEVSVLPAILLMAMFVDWVLTGLYAVEEVLEEVTIRVMIDPEALPDVEVLTTLKGGAEVSLPRGRGSEAEARTMTLPPALTPTVSIKNSIAKYMCSLLGGSCGCNGGG